MPRVSFAALTLAALFTFAAAGCETTVFVRPCSDGECGGEGEGGSGAGGPGECPQGTKACGNECVNLKTDPDHCGTCANDCAADAFCVDGTCTSDCPGLQCGDLCVDPSTNNQHCGNCNNPCGFDQVCSGGVCASECTFPLQNCGGSCVDTDWDTQHCGGCFNPCNNGELCELGICTSTKGCPNGICGVCDTAFLPQNVPQSVTGTTVNAQDTYTPVCAGTSVPEVLHFFTAPTTGVYQFDTIGSQYDTILSVLGPNGCVESFCEDDTVGFNEMIQMPLDANDSVSIIVDGFSTGVYQLNVSAVGMCMGGQTLCDGQCVDVQSDNDHCGFCNNPCSDDETCAGGFCFPNCAGPCGACGDPTILMGSVPQTVNGNTSGAPDNLFPSCTGIAGPEHVYEFTAPIAGSYTFSTANSGFDTVLTLLDANSCGELGCNDNFGMLQTSRITASLAAGQTVFIVVDGKNTSGQYSLLIQGTPAPTCPTSDLGSTVPITVSGSTVGGMNGFVPVCRPQSTAPEHTFLFTAPNTGTYVMNTVGSTYDTVLHVLGATCAGTSVACDDDGAGGLQSQIILSLAQGQTVTVVVDGFGANAGSYVLNIQQQ